MDWLSEKIDAALEWLLEVFQDFIRIIWDLITDLLIFITELILDAIVVVIGLIPVPEFFDSGLSSLVGSFPALLLYIMDNSGIDTALSILAAGLSFRLLRKFLTLFQW